MNPRQIAWTVGKCMKMIKQLDTLIDGNYGHEDEFWKGILKAGEDLYQTSKQNRQVGKAMSLTACYMGDLMKLLRGDGE